MRAPIKIYIVCIILLLTNMSVILFVNNNVAAQTDTEPQDLTSTYFWMKDGFLLTPEMPDSFSSPCTCSCPPVTEPMYPRAPGRFFRQYQWTTLADTFDTSNINSAVTLGQQVKFKLWFDSTVEELSTIRFRFTLLHNGDPIVETDIVEYYRTLSVGDEAYVETQDALQVEMYQMEAGDHLSIMIDYWVNGDGLRIKYGNYVYDSGIEIEANSIKIEDITATQSKLSAYFNEAFNVNPATLFFDALINDVSVEDEYSLAENTKGTFSFWYVTLEQQTYFITIYASYGSRGEDYLLKETQIVEVGETNNNEEPPPPPPPEPEPPEPEPEPPEPEPPEPEPPSPPPDSNPPEDPQDDNTQGNTGSGGYEPADITDDSTSESRFPLTQNNMLMAGAILFIIIIIIAFLVMNRRPRTVEDEDSYY
jgi:hypothetical protein